MCGSSKTKKQSFSKSIKVSTGRFGSKRATAIGGALRAYQKQKGSVNTSTSKKKTKTLTKSTSKKSNSRKSTKTKNRSTNTKSNKKTKALDRYGIKSGKRQERLIKRANSAYRNQKRRERRATKLVKSNKDKTFKNTGEAYSYYSNKIKKDKTLRYMNADHKTKMATQASKEHMTMQSKRRKTTSLKGKKVSVKGVNKFESYMGLTSNRF